MSSARLFCSSSSIVRQNAGRRALCRSRSFPTAAAATSIPHLSPPHCGNPVATTNAPQNLLHPRRRYWSPASSLSSSSPINADPTPRTHQSAAPVRQNRRNRSDYLKQRAVRALQGKGDGARPDDGVSVAGKSPAANDIDKEGAGVGSGAQNAGIDTRSGAFGVGGKGGSVTSTSPLGSPAAGGTTANSAPRKPEGASGRSASGGTDGNNSADSSATEGRSSSSEARPTDLSHLRPHVQLHEFAPKIVVVGVGGAGTNAVNNMVASGLSGVEFLALNTDAQHLSTSLCTDRIQIGTALTSGLGCGANPDAGRLAAEESKEAIAELLEDAHMVFITAGMGGGTGTGAAPVVAGLCYEMGILTVSFVTKPFRFEGTKRMRLANEGIERLRAVSDTLIVVPNQNLFRLVGPKTSFVDSFRLADDVLLAGVRSITDLMTSPGLINLDFADVQSVMHGMGNAMLGTGQACNDDHLSASAKGKAPDGGADDGSGTVAGDESGNSTDQNEGDDCRAVRASKLALNNPLLGDGNMDIGSAKGVLVNITGGSDMTLYEVDRAAECITDRVLDPDANIIFGSAYDSNLTGCVRVSVVATGIDED